MCASKEMTPTKRGGPGGEKAPTIFMAIVAGTTYKTLKHDHKIIDTLSTTHKQHTVGHVVGSTKILHWSPKLSKGTDCGSCIQITTKQTKMKHTIRR